MRDLTLGTTRNVPSAHERASSQRAMHEEGAVLAASGCMTRAILKAVHFQKAILECGKLDRRLRRAIGHAHDAEVPGL